MADPAGLVQKNQANVTSGKHIHNYSTFDKSLSYRFWNTVRFGDYTPSFDMEGVPSDEISLNSLDRIDSLSLKAPFKGSIRKIKESFSVPNMAILPLQWDRIYAQPSNGDDVPQDANCVIADWLSNCKTLWSKAYDLVRSFIAGSDSTAGTNLSYFYTGLLRMMVLGEYMFSKGSLLHVSGYRFGYQYFGFPVQKVGVASDGTTPTGTNFDRKSYDYWFDMVCRSVIFTHVRDIWVTDQATGITHKYSALDADFPAPSTYESFRALLELFRENPLCYVSQVYRDDRYSTDADLITAIKAAVMDDPAGPFYKTASNYLWKTFASDASTDDVTALNPHVLNLSRVLAYQLVCAHFYTNSSIDFLYSAELYREYIGQLLRYKNSNYQALYFSWNGQNLPYDYLSGHALYIHLFTGSTAQPADFNNTLKILGGPLSYNQNPTYLSLFFAWPLIFGFRKSLRYGDYFTASRPRPLAPVNTDVSVNNSMVSVIDITRNIQAQRFANAVMRSRSKIEDYVKSLFGRAPAPDFHNPFFLTRTTETIFGDEVQNTAESQISNPNSRTSNFASNISPYTFTFHNDDNHPCVYLQIISFDVRRAYSRSVDRQMLHIDRFDMFNPDFQYIGDQAVYGIELGYDNAGQVPSIFSYQTRDMEYKQRFDVVSGGFIDDLPGWCLTDLDRSKISIPNLDPDFIRSYNTELDQFFISLTGYSLGTYFHFICITDNNVSAKRPMAVDPQILA